MFRVLQLRAVAAVPLVALLVAPPALAVADHFESPHVHPVEMSPDGTALFAVHTADHRVAIFDLTGPGGPAPAGWVPVGLEPVTVRARTDDEIWVVCHVSDAVFIVDVPTRRVVRTLLTGDEPTDVVFAGGRAIVCLSQEDRLRAWSLADLDAPPVDIPLNQSDPRSLAVSGDGTEVYVCALDSQNRTTVVPEGDVTAAGGPPAPDPPMAAGLPAAPEVGLIVRHDGAAWRDEAGTSWNAAIGYTLPDHDVIRIDATSLAVTGAWTGAGTTLFNAAVDPATGRVFVTGQAARNEIRFEPNLKGRFATNDVAILEPGGNVTRVHLNSHIDYANPAGSSGERALSLALPTDITFRSDGSEAFVAATGSDRIGVLDAAGQVTRRIAVGGGPTGVALDEARQRLYVVNRFPGTLSVVELGPDTSVEIALGFDPTAPEVLAGRRFLYDAELSSAHGDLACATCHVFGGMDNIAWDLGDPEGEFVPAVPGVNTRGFHPMKGPMTTQSLKALTDTEPFHWRGDRATFADFNGAFVSLLGRSAELSPGDMQAFEAFLGTIRYPANPLRGLDGSLPLSIDGADPAQGELLFHTGDLVGAIQCVDCHTLPTGENGLVIAIGSQDVVVPQLRNLYEKTRFDNTAAETVRGFGYLHSGEDDDLFSFLQFPAFTFQNDDDRRDVAAFLLAFDTGTHPGVGAAWTMDGTNEGDGSARLAILESLADSDTIGLLAKGRDGLGEARGWVYLGGGSWRPDRQAQPEASSGQLLAMAGPGSEVTFLGVLEGDEWRLGVDRDADGWLDRDELDYGTDPDDPASAPGAVDAPLVAAAGLSPRLERLGANPARDATGFAYSLARPGAVRLDVFDLTGRRVRTLVDAPRRETGTHRAAWDLRDEAGRRVAAGHYFVRLRSAAGTDRARVVVLR